MHWTEPPPGPYSTSTGWPRQLHVCSLQPACHSERSAAYLNVRRRDEADRPTVDRRFPPAVPDILRQGKARVRGVRRRMRRRECRSQLGRAAARQRWAVLGGLGGLGGWAGWAGWLAGRQTLRGLRCAVPDF